MSDDKWPERGVIQASEVKKPCGTHAAAELPLASKVYDPGLPASRTILETMPEEVVVRVTRPLWTLVVLQILGLALVGFGIYHLGGKLDALCSYKAIGGK